MDNVIQLQLVTGYLFTTLITILIVIKCKINEIWNEFLVKWIQKQKVHGLIYNRQL